MADKMMNALREYGADIPGIEERFMGNMELYANCFQLVLEDPNFPGLRKALEEEDYQQAFYCAHSLKGVTDNMGLSPLCKEICVLVEALRAKHYDDLDLQYSAVAKAYEDIKNLL